MTVSACLSSDECWQTYRFESQLGHWCSWYVVWHLKEMLRSDLALLTKSRSRGVMFQHFNYLLFNVLQVNWLTFYNFSVQMSMSLSKILPVSCFNVLRVHGITCISFNLRTAWTINIQLSFVTIVLLQELQHQEFVKPSTTHNSRYKNTS